MKITNYIISTPPPPIKTCPFNFVLLLLDRRRELLRLKASRTTSNLYRNFAIKIIWYVLLIIGQVRDHVVLIIACLCSFFFLLSNAMTLFAGKENKLCKIKSAKYCWRLSIATVNLIRTRPLHRISFH